jgi:peptidylprolyl isomerase
MKRTAFLLLLASVAFSQTPNRPTAPATKPAIPATGNSAAMPGSAQSKPAATPAPAAQKTTSDLPVLHGVAKQLFEERYEEIKPGTGALAEPNKIYHVIYTGYLASTGQKFDSSTDHPAPVIKDGKPVIDADGKPQLGAPEPLVFPQGMGRLIPGFDQGFDGMRVGGKRRIFIPWQLAYGTRAVPPRGGHIGIPPKSDLIFDVELVDVTDMPVLPPGAGTPRPAPTPTPGSQPSAPPADTVPATPPTSNSPTTPPTGSPQLK